MKKKLRKVEEENISLKKSIKLIERRFEIENLSPIGKPIGMENVSIYTSDFDILKEENLVKEELSQEEKFVSESSFLKMDEIMEYECDSDDL